MRAFIAGLAMVACVLGAASCGADADKEEPTKEVTVATNNAAGTSAQEVAPTNTAVPPATGSSLPRGFIEARDSGASCQALFDIRNSADPKSPAKVLINDELLRIGCLSSSSERTDIGRPAGTEGLEPINYNSSYMVCKHDPEGLYAESGTNTAEEAAAYIAEGSRVGVARDSSYQGCLDALTGKPNAFSQ
ncbi:MAG: hypothetical protein HY874_01995 [Chloroflexi bacterium]|nr:hypothetical protein [Chloroflexota bacterium]